MLRNIGKLKFVWKLIMKFLFTVCFSDHRSEFFDWCNVIQQMKKFGLRFLTIKHYFNLGLYTTLCRDV